MPSAPSLPTNVASGGTTSGHKSHTDTVHGVVNSAYKATIGATRTAGFTVAQSDSGEVIPVDSSSAAAVTVPSRDAGTTVEVVRKGSGAVTFTASGVTFLKPDGSTAAARVQGSSVALLWLTTTEVLMSGDLA